MKTRNLLLGAFAALAAFSSCSSEEENLKPANDNIYVQNINRFGTKSSSVKINVGSVQGFNLTRGVDVNGNMWSFMPEYPTSEEVAGVMAYISGQTNPTSVALPGYTYYYVQHVGGAHKQYGYADMNGAWHGNIDGTSSMEHLQIKENSGTWQHVYNFNGGKCDNGATHNSVLMTDGFQGAKTMNEYAASTISGWCLFYWNGNYYLGFDFSQKKGDGEIPGDGVYDDWVMKIIPGKGETPVSPQLPGVDPEDPAGDDPTGDDPADDPDEDPYYRVPSVEVDIHHQQHTDWNELKTSIHLRDTVDVRVFIPVPQELQAIADDFDIRTGEDYTYLEGGFSEVIPVTYLLGGEEFSVNVQVNHKADGIEMLIEGAECAQALKHARGIYDDGITFEIHSYINPDVTPEYIWNNVLKNVQVPGTSLSRWPGDNDCVTITYGQIHAALFEDEEIKFDKHPGE